TLELERPRNPREASAGVGLDASGEGTLSSTPQHEGGDKNRERGYDQRGGHPLAPMLSDLAVRKPGLHNRDVRDHVPEEDRGGGGQPEQDEAAGAHPLG